MLFIHIKFFFIILTLICTLSCSHYTKSQKPQKDGKKVESAAPAPDTVKKETPPTVTTVYDEDQDSIIIKDSFEIAFLLPLFLDSILYESEEGIPAVALVGLEFYEGMLVAIDSLKYLDLKIKLHVFDTRNDTNYIKKLLKEGAIKKADLIIGPIHSDDLKIVAGFAKRNKIPCFSPLSPAVVSDKNKHFAMLTPSIQTHCQNITHYLLQQYGSANYIVIRSERQYEDEKSFTYHFKNYLQQGLDKKPEKKSAKEYIKSFTQTQEIEQLLSTNEKNIIFIPSFDESYVTFLLSQLKNLLDKKYEIIVIGMPVWLKFESMDIEFFEKLQVHLTTNWWVNYDELRVNNFRKKYIETFNTEPSKYAFQGYDTFYVIAKILFNKGKKLDTVLDNFAWNGLCNRYRIQAIKLNNKIYRYENLYVHILKFQGFHMVKLN